MALAQKLHTVLTTGQDDGKPATIQKLFETEGIILNEEECRSIAALPNPDLPKAAAKIAECHLQRRLKQFLKTPIIADLGTNTDLIDPLLAIIADKDHETSKLLMKDWPNHTHTQILDYIRWMKSPQKKSSLFSLRNILFAGAAIAVAVGAYVWYRYTKSASPAPEP